MIYSGLRATMSSGKVDKVTLKKLCEKIRANNKLDEVSLEEADKIRKDPTAYIKKVLGIKPAQGKKETKGKSGGKK